MTALPKVPAQGQNLSSIDFNAAVTVTTTKHSVRESEKKQKYNAIKAAVSVPLASLYPKHPLKGNATLSFVEYTDSKGVFHRQVTQKHLKISSKAFEPFFDMLTHAIVVRNNTPKNKTDKKSDAPQVPETIQLKDKDIKVKVSKKGEPCEITVIASATINPDLQVVAVQNKKGISDIRQTQKTLSAIEKAKKEGKKDVDAIIHALQKTALARIGQFNKDNADKKIDKKPKKENEVQKKDAPQKAVGQEQIKQNGPKK